jgi:hypothetical protein
MGDSGGGVMAAIITGSPILGILMGLITAISDPPEPKIEVEPPAALCPAPGWRPPTAPQPTPYSWPDFVRWVSEQDFAEMDLHVRPQWLRLTCGGILDETPCTHIIELNDLNMELPKLIPGANVEQRNKGRYKKRDRTEAWTPELIEMHRKRFEVDFEQLGYE